MLMMDRRDNRGELRAPTK